MSQIYFEVDEELKRKFRAECASNGDSVKDVLTNAVQDYTKKKGNVLWHKK